MKKKPLLGMIGTVLLAACVLGDLRSGAQSPATAPAVSATDPVAAAAEAWIGRALIVRGFPAASELEYDRSGRLLNSGKSVDWTLAGMNLEKVSRRGNDALQLDGTRVAIRYNPDQHQFDRHPLKETHVRVTFPAADASSVNRVMAAIFSTGIDPALERSMPAYWSHYFLPGSDWLGTDALAGVTIIPANGKLPEGAVLPEAEKKPEPDYTAEARMDRVKGTVWIRLVVDADGVPRRVTIRQPLGYGLDARTAEAVARWRFRPGTVGGKPAAMEVLVYQAFDFAVAPPV